MTWRLNQEQWLFCLRIGLSVILAYFVTHGRDPTNAVYAVMGAGLVTAPNFGEGVGVSKERLIGTFLGAFVSVPASWVGDPFWALVLCVCTIAPLGIMLGGVSIARIAVTMATVAVVLHSDSAEVYGFFRFTNTAAGVVVALLVGLAFWPVCGRKDYDRSMGATLDALAALAENLAAVDDDRKTTRFGHQSRLFLALAGMPKTANHINLDPLLYQMRLKIRREIQLVAKVGISLLAISLGQAHGGEGSTEYGAPARIRCQRIAIRLRALNQWHLTNNKPRMASGSPPADMRDDTSAVQAFPGTTRIVEDLRMIEGWLDEIESLHRSGVTS